MKVKNLYAHLIIEELIRLGVEYFCLAPGSRSTPLVYEVAKKKEIQDFIHYDERGLGFHALGYAKAMKKPAVIIITSGSSLSNLFPAVIEAHFSNVPLLILSGDRPFELGECGSNQAIDQVKFFHKYTTWQSDLPLNDEKLPIRSVLSTVDLAYHNSLKGPVHLNLRFREPFLQDIDLENPSEYLLWKNSSSPHQSYLIEDQGSLSLKLDLHSKGLIILGKDTLKEDLLYISKVAKDLGYPIYADILAPRSECISSYLIPHFEAVIKAKELFDVETVLQFGGPFTSKPLLQYLQKHPLKSYYQIESIVKRSDPLHLPSKHLICSAKAFYEAIDLSSFEEDSNWFQSIQTKSVQISSFLDKYFRNDPVLTEPFVLRSTFKHAIDHQIFYIASSMPIRDALFFGHLKDNLEIFCNRGASGIDGNLATAFGISQAKDRPITIVIGDVAFLYDLNSLAQLKEIKHPPKIIVINNAGCGIFNFLPIKKQDDIFDRYFQVPHSYNFQGAADQFGLSYHKPNSQKEFEKVIIEESNAPQLIEVVTKSHENLILHQKIENEIKEALGSN